MLGLSSYQIKLNLALPRLLESGLTTKRLGQAELHEFCANLHILIRSLPSETLLTHITDPLTVKLLIKGKFHDHQLPEPYARLDTPECDSRIANLPLIQLRIWAEMNRFIAFTGCNLSIAQSLNLGNWREERENLIALKARANKLVSIRSSKLYAKHIDAHTNFLLKCLLVPVSDDCPLFPRIVTNCQGDSSLIAKAQAGLLEINVKPLDPNENKTNIRKWLYRTGITVYTSRTLRLAKATWLLRRYHGDQIRVAQGMGNKPSTVYRNYGGKGNLEQSILEWSEFWASSPLQAALTPGKCNAPGKYKPLDDQPVAPCTEGACLSCQNYRGEDNFDYVHRLLSYQYCLSFRAYGNPEIANLGGFIDEIINAYIKLHPEHKLKILFLKQVIAENPHPRFTALAQLGEALYGN
ncbi:MULTISPECIES: hypothetical protein [Halomonadaceae]|uniref:hypothetical protein n=1 Tax=Halomonadaceae TaxID=28256 RepID=UPI00186878B7|nr:hypothetical protein [Halomonas sp. 3D7M]